MVFCQSSAASATGTSVQLGFLGTLDKILTGKQSNKKRIDLFRKSHVPYGYFAIETITHSPTSNSRSETRIEIIKAGERAAHFVLKTHIPAIKACEGTSVSCNSFVEGALPTEDLDDCCNLNFQVPAQGCSFEEFTNLQPEDGEAFTRWATWIPNIGHAMFDCISFIMGTQTLDTVNNHSLHMYEELHARPSFELEEEIGKYDSRAALIEFSSADRILYTPLPLATLEGWINCLPISSARFTKLQIAIRRMPIQKLVHVGGVPAGENASVVCKCSDGQPLREDDIFHEIIAHHVHVEDGERDLLESANYYMLAPVHQYQEIQLEGKRSCQAEVNLKFPVIDIKVALQRHALSDENYHLKYDGLGGKDPIKTIQYLFSNQPRTSELEASYYRLVQPHISYTHKPSCDSFIYPYSFALDAGNNHQFSGTANFSRIDIVHIRLVLQDHVVSGTGNGIESERTSLHICARGVQKIKFYRGLAGPTYASDVDFKSKFTGDLLW